MYIESMRDRFCFSKTYNHTRGSNKRIESMVKKYLSPSMVNTTVTDARSNDFDR